MFSLFLNKAFTFLNKAFTFLFYKAYQVNSIKVCESAY